MKNLPRLAARLFIVICIVMVIVFIIGHFSDKYKCSVTSTVPSANGALLIDTEEEKRATRVKKGDAIMAFLACCVACLCFYPVFLSKEIDFNAREGYGFVALTGATALAAAWTSYTAQNLDVTGVLKNKDGSLQSANKDSTCKHPVGGISAFIAWTPIAIIILVVLLFGIGQGCKMAKAQKCLDTLAKIGVKV